MSIHEWFCPNEHWLLCKNINQPYTDESAKDVLPIIELLTSHLKNKSKLTNGDGESIPYCTIFLLIHLYKNDLLGA